MVRKCCNGKDGHVHVAVVRPVKEDKCVETCRPVWRLYPVEAPEDRMVDHGKNPKKFFKDLPR